MYYYRPWKTILVRTVADGGKSFYFPGDHQVTIPTLWREALSKMGTRAASLRWRGQERTEPRMNADASR
jgi:hypothetical protein